MRVLHLCVLVLVFLHVSSKRLSSLEEDNNHQPQGKTLVYITTHMPEDHRAFLETCWPAALKHSELLSLADVMVFNSGSESHDDLLRRTFKEQDLTIHHEPVLRMNGESQRQDGAKLAMQRAYEEQWFAGYDWVIRVNPDVIVRDGAALQSMMAKQDVDGIFADCQNAPCPQGSGCTSALVQTDFTCFRPSKVCTDGCGGVAALKMPGNAETLMTQQVKGIIDAKRDAWLRDVQGIAYTTPEVGRCKVSTREGSPVAHYHHYSGEDDNSPETCLAWFHKHGSNI